MKRKMQRRTSRWSERPGQIEVVSPYADTPPVWRDPRNTDYIAGPGPYESSYDISLGYNHDRTIHLP